jgi:hypothetical protein
MVAGGNVTYVCEECGSSFIGWKSAERKYCTSKCAAAVRSREGLTHGESYTKLYEIWCWMKARCRGGSPLTQEYYSSQGITVWPEWENSYETFRDWALANGYREGLELDRKRSEEGYNPDNCRWATRSQNMRNTRKRKDAQTSQYKGVSRHKDKWRAQITCNGRNRHLGLFPDEIQAAHAYDDAAFDIAGTFARLNFPDRKQKESSNFSFNSQTQ